MQGVWARVVPDAYTHGTSDQHVRWFTRVFEGGAPNECGTFQASVL